MGIDKEIILRDAKKESLKRVPLEQVQKCAAALSKHVALVLKKLRKEKADLFEEVDDGKCDLSVAEHDTGKLMFLSFSLKQTPAKAFKSFKSYRVKLTNPLCQLNANIDVCLFVKDKDEAKQWLEKTPIAGVKKVISLKQLRTSYHSFQSRRDLVARFDYFLADDRIVCMLPKTLGRIFYNGPKKPVAFRFAQNKSLAPNVEKRVKEAVESSYFNLTGSCCTMRIARIGFSPEEVAANAIDAISEAIQHIPKGWDNVQAIHMKTGKSLALPIYNDLPDSGIKIADIAKAKVPKEKSKKSAEGGTEAASKPQDKDGTLELRKNLKKRRKDKTKKKVKKRPALSTALATKKRRKA